MGSGQSRQAINRDGISRRCVLQIINKPVQIQPTVPDGFVLVERNVYKALLLETGRFNFRFYVAKDTEFCPLSQDLIKNSSLDFAPDLCWHEDHPNLNACELPCGHKFTTMLLMFHFVKNSCQECPVCKYGVKQMHWSEHVIPKHVYLHFAAQLFREQAAAQSDV
jgi:hypothetical protein